MKTITDLQTELRELALELERFKEKPDGLAVDFAGLSDEAARSPIEEHPLANSDEHAQRCYIILLLTVARLDLETLSGSLLYAHKVAFGMGYLQKGKTLRDEFIASQTVDDRLFDEIRELFSESDIGLVLISDCLFMAAGFNRGKRTALEYVSQLASLMCVRREMLVALANLTVAFIQLDEAAMDILDDIYDIN